MTASGAVSLEWNQLRTISISRVARLAAAARSLLVIADFCTASRPAATDRLSTMRSESATMISISVTPASSR